MKAMLLAAGLGTRLKPWTDQHPKALVVIKGKSLLQRNVEYLQAFNITDIVVNVHHFADQIVDSIAKNNGWGSKITISDEMSEVLETGGGLMKAAPFLTGHDPFVLMNADILTCLDLESMIAYHSRYSPLATVATSIRQTSRYFLFNSTDDLVGWRNVKTGEERGLIPLPENVKQRAFSGIHIISPELFSLVKQHGKFSMVDVYLSLMKDHSIKSYDHASEAFMDVGKPESLIQAEDFVSKRGLEAG